MIPLSVSEISALDGFCDGRARTDEWWWLSVPIVGRESREASLLAGDATTGSSQVGESAFPPLGHHATGHTHTSLALCFVCRYSPHTVVLALLSSWQMTWPADGEKCFPRWWCSVCATTVTPWLTCHGKDTSVDVLFGWVRLQKVGVGLVRWPNPLATGSDIHGIGGPDQVRITFGKVRSSWWYMICNFQPCKGR